MPKSVVVAWTIFLLFSTGRAHAENAVQPSFDCAKAAQPIEKAICADPGLAELDRKMGDEFRKVIDQSPVESRPVIQAQQRHWLKLRDDCVASTNGPDTPTACLVSHYKLWLEQWPKRLAALGGATGTSFTLRIPKYPSLPVLALSKSDALCRRLHVAAVASFQQPNEIHNPGEIDGFVRRLEIRGARWIDLSENAETIGANKVLAVPLSGPKAYAILLVGSRLNYITKDESLYVVPAERLAALKSVLEHQSELPSDIDRLSEVSAFDEVYPIQILHDGKDYYVAEESNWSEIKLSKIEPGRKLEPTCVVKYPQATPVGLAFGQWIADIQQIQGQEGPLSGSAHYLNVRLVARESLAQLAASRPSDIVQFGLFPPDPSGDPASTESNSPLQAKLGLAVWGLSGPWNHVKLKRFEGESDAARTELVRYYMSVYGIAADDAARAAQIATDAILKQSFYFSSGGKEERQRRRAPAEVEQGIRDQADAFARSSVDQRDARQATDLIRPAIMAGASKADIEAMIAAGAELGNRKTKFEDRFPDATEPALFFSLGRPDIATLLIDKGVDVNQGNAFGKTALMYAAHLDLYDSLDLLLTAKAEVNAVTTPPPPDDFDMDYVVGRSRRSALMYAAENASRKLIDRLIDSGADVHATDSEGNGISFYLDLNRRLTGEERDAVRKRLN